MKTHKQISKRGGQMTAKRHKGKHSEWGAMGGRGHKKIVCGCGGDAIAGVRCEKRGAINL